MSTARPSPSKAGSQASPVPAPGKGAVRYAWRLPDLAHRVISLRKAKSVAIGGMADIEKAMLIRLNL